MDLGCAAGIRWLETPSETSPEEKSDCNCIALVTVPTEGSMKFTLFCLGTELSSSSIIPELAVLCNTLILKVSV
jgi:hypothetical protein